MKKIVYVLAVCAATLMLSCKGSDKKPEATSSDNDKKTETVAPAPAEKEAPAEADLDVEIEDEPARALVGAYDGVAEDIGKVESKEDLEAICMALGETLKELEKKYPDYTPDEEIAKGIKEASEAVGEAIVEAGNALKMSPEEIQEFVKYIDAEEAE